MANSEDGRHGLMDAVDRLWTGYFLLRLLYTSLAAPAIWMPILEEISSRNALPSDIFIGEVTRLLVIVPG